MKDQLKTWVKGDGGRLVVLLGIFILFAVMVPDGRFTTVRNVENILVQSCVVALAAIGATLVILSSGIDLSVGSVLALSVVVIARILELPEEIFGIWTPWIAILLGLGVGAVCGWLNGVMVTWLGMVPFVVTLATLQIYRGLASGLAGETNIYPRESWVFGLMDPVIGTGDRGWMLLPPVVWITLVSGIFVWILIRNTRLGRHMVAVGSNEETARLCGVRVGRVKQSVYLIAGFFAGLAGLMQFAYIGIGQPTTGQGYELMVIAAVVIGGGSLSGGKGTIPGTVIGALIIRVLFVGCVQMGWPKWMQTVVTGLIIAVAVLLDQLRHRGE